jgi:Fe-S-cluster containining protein
LDSQRNFAVPDPLPNQPRPASEAARLAEFALGLSPHERDVLNQERALVAELLVADRSAAGAPAAAQACTHADQLGRTHLRLLAAPPAFACHEGCHFCCYLKVSVTPPEVFWIAEQLARTASSAERARIAALALELSADPRIFSEYEKPAARLPCPLLSDAGACSVYEARPLACRAWNALDAEACRRALDDDSEPPTVHEPLARLYAATSLGLLGALGDAGLDAPLLELTSALAIALSNPQALELWLAGEPVFAPAHAQREPWV